MKKRGIILINVTIVIPLQNFQDGLHNFHTNGCWVFQERKGGLYLHMILVYDSY